MYEKRSSSIVSREIRSKRNKWREKKLIKGGKKDAAKPKVASFPWLITGYMRQAIKQIIKQQLKRERK